MRSGELFLVYMPIVELASGRWVGAEALLRWQPRYGEAIEPGVFVPMAERHNRIRKLTATMLALFAADGREHLSQHAASLYFSLNLAAADLSDASVVTRVCRSRDAAGVRRIMVEATEGSLINFAKAGTQIRRLRDEGIRVAIDDFGTGYSSLSYLGSLQVDSIKIDASFVRAIGTDTARSQVIRHIIEMAKDLELDMIAEGVETRAQADYLRVCGVQYGQGWLFGRPMPAKQFIEAMIASRGALPD